MGFETTINIVRSNCGNGIGKERLQTGGHGQSKTKGLLASSFARCRGVNQNSFSPYDHL